MQVKPCNTSAKRNIPFAIATPVSKQQIGLKLNNITCMK